jgi:Carboxypeptidase regulatory-like domain
MKRAFAISVLLASTLLSAQEPARQLRGAYTIEGRVVDALTGNVLHKAIVMLASVTQRARTQQYEVDADGSFSFQNLAPGKYALSVQARGFTPQLYEEHGGFNTGIAVGPGKVSTGIVFRVQPEGSIVGQVLDEHNEAVREAHVLLFEKSTDMGKRMVQPRGQKQSDDQGQYEFHHLRPGTYYLAISAQPWYRRYLQTGGRRGGLAQEQKPAIDPALDTAYPVTYYPGATAAEDAGAIVVHPGDHMTANFDLAPVASLHLTIRNTTADGGGQVMPNFLQRVFGEQGAFFQPTMDWKEGEVEVSGFAPGAYTLDLIRPGGTRFGGQESNREQEISLQSNGELDALSAGADLAPIHGKLTFEGTQSPKDTFIQLLDSGTNRPIGTRVEDSGEFTVQPPHPGRYVISLGNAQGYAIRTITANGARVSGRAIEVTGQPVELMMKASEGVAIINGTVLKDAKPISGTMVVLVPQDIADNVSLFRRDQSDSDGTFTLHDVVPGRYTAIAIQNGWDIEWASTEALRPYLAKGTPVEVSGKQEMDIKLTAQ